MRIPASTYRLQITEDFDLLEAARTLAYLHDLGVDWVYLSPVLAAESGSDHGYDVSDHSAIDASRGRGAGLAALSSEARRLGMGVLVDIVPNHVGIARPWENAWWWHVLTHGQESPYAGAFDIDWEAGGGRVLVPVVGDDDLADDGRIGHLRVLAGELHYHDQRFPLAPGTADAEAADDPDAVHARQHYELVHWRRGDSELNYRRFFSVNTLAAIRVEEAEWFERSHEEIGALVRRRARRRAAHRPPRRPARPGEVPRRPRRAHRRGVRARREDPGAGRASCPTPGRPPGRPGTTRSRSSTGC